MSRGDRVCTLDFQFNLSAQGWSDKSVYTFKGPTIDLLEHYLYLKLDRELEVESLAAYADAQIQIINSTLTHFETLQHTRSVVGKVPTAELLFRWIPDETIVRYRKYLFAIRDHVGFTFNCDFSRNSYSLLSEQMTAIARHLLNPAAD